MAVPRQVAHILSTVVLVAGLGLLAHVHLRHVINGSIYYDDAHNANVAKNLAFGFGYSTSYHEIIPFNPEASTGPAILLPAAALVRVFGNQYWVPNLAITLCIWATLLLLVYLMRSYCTRDELHVSAGLIALALVLFPDEIGLLGEVPGALLGCASVLVACRVRERLWPVLAAGALLGLAIQSKLIMALLLPPTLLYLLLASQASQARSVRRRLTESALFIFGAVVPFAAWQGWQVFALGDSGPDVLVVSASHYSFFETWSGIGELRQAPSVRDHFLEKMARNGTQLPHHFGGWQLLTLFPAALSVCLCAVGFVTWRHRRFTALTGPGLVILAAAIIHLMWWLLFSREGWYRHLLPGTLYFVIAAVLAMIAAVRASRISGALAAVLLLLSWVPLYDQRAAFIKFRYEVDRRVTSLLAARDEIVTLQKNPDLLLVGYGWWVPRDLEFVLPAVGNFKDLQRLRPEDVRGRTIVLIRNEFFNLEGSVALSAFQRACDRRVIFKREPFVISECAGLWQLTFPWAESEPRRLREEHSFAAAEGPDGNLVTVAHATSALEFDPPGPIGEIEVGFGILDGAWQIDRTDGVEFRISIVESQGISVLWSRFLDPAFRPRDRGQQTATIRVPETFVKGKVLAETLPGEKGDSRWDRAFWSRIIMR